MESLEKNDSVPPVNNVRHKIVVMGAAKVGKSSIITQFLYGSFSPKYKRTVEEMHHGDFNVSGVSDFILMMSFIENIFPIFLLDIFFKGCWFLCCLLL